MRNWGEIPIDIATKIAEHIYYNEDFMAFGRVCTQWRRAKKAAKLPPTSRVNPRLMLAEPSCTWKRRLYSLYNHKIEHLELPDPHTLRGDEEEQQVIDDHSEGEDDIVYLSCKGWLLCITKLDFRFFLVHPNCKKIIRLPPAPRKFHKLLQHLALKASDIFKFCLSDDPLNSREYTVVVPASSEIWFWCSNDDKWSLHSDKVGLPMEITFYQGDVYGIDDNGEVTVYKRTSITDHEHGCCALFESPKLLTRVPMEWWSSFPGTIYIVESAGALLVILRQVKVKKEYYSTDSFKVWEVNTESGECREVKTLRGGGGANNRAVFVGPSSSFSVQTSPPHCKPNCIYYTDNLIECYSDSERGAGSDMGVFDLTCGQTIQQHFSNCPYTFSFDTPPLWVQDSSTQ